MFGRVENYTNSPEISCGMGISKYSICITHRNDISTIRQSLDSILNQIDDSFEVVVVDSRSEDGSLEVLKEYETAGRIRLIVASCNRGRGRQLAFENSTGDYVIANMDMDDIFAPTLTKMLDFYHSNYEGKIIRIFRSPSNGKKLMTSITIGPRDVISRVGGWRSLSWFEDDDLWNRAARLGIFANAEFPIMIRKAKYDNAQTRVQLPQSYFSRIRHRFVVYRDGARAGVPLQVDLKKFPIFVAARIAALLPVQ